MATLIDCGDWQVLVDRVFIEGDDDINYDNILMAYSIKADAAYTGKLAENVVFNLIPFRIFIQGLRKAA